MAEEELNNIKAQTFLNDSFMIRKFFHDDKYFLEIAYRKENSVSTNRFDSEAELNDYLNNWQEENKDRL